MSKELFEQHREEEIHTMVSMPYSVYLQYKEDSEINFIKHFIPELREEYKKNKEWRDFDNIIKGAKEKQKEIESEIRVNGRYIKKHNDRN